ncbi:transglutaminase domain-containing protein [Chamaesiphon sp. OTE_20_metabat_361]|uniref:transglutaminase domain-containing protein n=1 Tax=Chamaesiphon sp. OTE_20_metabat_361 TaxID=2964689 RepID=UPI002869FA2A|nr:transglutaminase domain-containing protein [Chamaesiphon sp. OTE_20_metabat_361]
MPQNLERDFQKAVLKLKHKKKNLLKRRIQTFLKSTIARYWFISLLLLVAIINGMNPYLVKDFSVRIKYGPKPPLLASPWSWKNNQTIHSAVANIPPDIESGIKSVAEYIARQESDPYLRIKALHDYVISRVSYDFHALKMGRYPSQDAQTVFSTRKAVCGGYANLFMALSQAIGINTVVIQGDIRQDLAPPNSISTNADLLNPNTRLTLHAWNAVKVADNWQLVDTTWDDINSNQNISLYKSDYLMPPPEVMIPDHFPAQSDWQLLHKPISRDYFEKQLILTPRFFTEDIQIVSPIEYKTSVQKNGFIQVKAPVNYSNKIVALFSEREKSNFSLWSLTQGNPFAQDNTTDVKTCQSQPAVGESIQISCQFSEIGIYQVLLFSLEQRENTIGPYPIAQFKFDAH